MGRRFAVVLTAAIVFAAAGCSPASPATTGPASGVIAIGHSGLTGEGTGSEFEPVLANSWATGTSPEVDSVYLRLKAVRPDLAGTAVNTARGGGFARELPGMAQRALEGAPNPALVIIQTIDNDIRCDGTDSTPLADFEASVREALAIVTARAPDARIIVVDQLGRPSLSFVEEVIAHDPTVGASPTSAGMCDLLDADGRPVEDHFEALTGIIEGYEAAQARACGEFPQCRTDGGVRAAYVDDLENFAPDWAHLNVRGQAAAAELIWPVVEETLGLAGKSMAPSGARPAPAAP